MDHTAPAISTWAERFRSLAAAGLPERFIELHREVRTAASAQPVAPPDHIHSWIAAFRDGEGNRRSVDGPLLSHMLGVQPPDLTQRASPEARAWATLARRDPTPTDGTIDWSGNGRLYPSLASDGIETWTEAELASLQAIAWLALHARSEVIMNRAVSAAAWLSREVQPDNATQRPWAAGFFIVRSMDASLSSRECQENALYAHTLIENALVGREHPDRFSACILWDSAAWLEALAASRWQGPPAWLGSVVAT